MNLKKFYNKKKILITGHTGFKGSWLVHWLSRYNVEIMGIGLNPYNKLNLFNYINKRKLLDKRIDITDYKTLEKNILKFKPDIIYHLAAQALVKKSIQNPLETFKTNIIGTANILNCINKLKKKTTSVIVTSDKCYESFKLSRGYQENDKLGGNDPYSASKASAEIIFKSFFNSILKKNKKIKIATARAGNVIGGGDWSSDRLIPDCVSAWVLNKKVNIRNPRATRPWQHILEPLSGYIMLSYHLQNNINLNGNSFNFGPKFNDISNVEEVLKLSKNYWKNAKINFYKEKDFVEDEHLQLNTQKVEKKLKWKKIFTIEKTIEMTMNWYKKFYDNKNVLQLLDNDINYYLKKNKNFTHE